MRLAVALAAFILAAAAPAQEPRPPTRQARLEERNIVCAAQADDRRLRGATRSAYMKQCIRGGGTPQIAAQQEKILECTEQAEDQSLEARERRRFLAECLRG
jgi:psiF repeat-containing protein